MAGAVDETVGDMAVAGAVWTKQYEVFSTLSSLSFTYATGSATPSPPEFHDIPRRSLISAFRRLGPGADPGPQHTDPPPMQS